MIFLRHTVLNALLILISCGCATKKAVETVEDKSARQVSTTVEEVPSAASQADSFDRFLRDRMGAKEKTALIKSCETEPDKNIFCFGILKADYFKKAVAARSRTRKSRRQKHLSPKFVNGQIKNWIELRFSPHHASLRSLGRLSEEKLSILEELAKKEDKCPNHIAISLAATLEDLLPDRANALDIATLYAKGADCLTESPTEQRTFWTRAGLFYFWNRKYQEALPLFEKASLAEDSFVNRSLYWKYRTLVELGEESKAAATLEEMSSRYPFSFHTLVAVTAAKQDPSKSLLEKDSSGILKRSLGAPAVNILIEQAEILSQYKFEQSAGIVLEWAMTESNEIEPELKVYMAQLSPREQTQITILADVLSDHPELISKETFNLYFPKAFFPIFEEHAGEIDPYLLLAIARQESAFNPKARSFANARGLLQVLPKTGRRHGRVSASELYDPHTNIRIGSQYMQDLLKSLNGQIHLALASYNAGPNRVKDWLDRYHTADPVLFTDLIPYQETRSYVALVLRNYYWYRRIHSQESLDPMGLVFNRPE